jgi:hypothetical protein
MKVSFSLSSDDVTFLDEYASFYACASGSTVVRRAIQVLRLGELDEAYGDAWAEWAASGEADRWDAT